MIGQTDYVTPLRIMRVRAGLMLNPPEVSPARCILNTPMPSHVHAPVNSLELNYV
jgi:hypothetical protein